MEKVRAGGQLYLEGSRRVENSGRGIVPGGLLSGVRLFPGILWSAEFFLR